MTLKVLEDDLTLSDIRALLTTHMIKMQEVSPPESCHALNLDAFSNPRLTLWTARVRGELMGCGALFELDGSHGEIKSMHTVEDGRPRGTGRSILTTIIATSRQRGYERLSLETGSQDYFIPARTLYGRFGFTDCEPFGSYIPDPNSVFMTLKLKS